jgi:hypothetical protein
MAYSSIAQSYLSTMVGITTLQANLQPPTVIAAKTDYFGTRITLWFSLPLNSSISITNHFTISTIGDTTPFKNVASYSYTTSSYSLSLTLDTPIANTGSTVSIGYDGLGVLNSTFGFSTAAFQDYPVSNLLHNSSLINGIYNVKLNGTASSYSSFNAPSGTTNWNVLNFTPYTTNSISTLVNSNGITSQLSFSLPSGSGANPQAAILTNIVSGGNSDFPSWSVGSGEIQNSALSFGNWSRYCFHNLDTTKKYVIKFFPTSYNAGGTASMDVDINNSFTENTQIVVTNNTNTTYTVYNIPTCTIKTVSGITWTPTPSPTTNFTTPSVVLNTCVSNNGNKHSSIICAIILYEINNESN